MSFFQHGGKMLAGNPMNKDMIGFFIGFIIWLMILLFFGEYLWNNVLVKVVPMIKPVKSIWQILGLSILFSILGGC